MVENKDTLALELRQIIQADRMAADIIQQARDSRKTIRSNVEKQKAEIVADAERKKQEIIARVEAQQAAALEERKNQAQADFDAQRKELDATMAKKHDAWKAEITRRILDGAGAE